MQKKSWFWWRQNRCNVWADSVWLCIFHFPLCTSQGIKVPLKIKLWASLTKAWSPRVILFFLSLLFSLCSSFRMTPWNTGALLAFCVNQGRSSLFLFPFYFPYCQCRHPKGTPGSCWGWSPAEHPQPPLPTGCGACRDVAAEPSAATFGSGGTESIAPGHHDRPITPDPQHHFIFE